MRTTLILSGLVLCAAAETIAADRPNVLWISCEDISPRLGCYGDNTASTPHLDRLAAEGIRFTNAYTCHGVCAPSRTGIITACYPSELGANHMRSKAGLPPHIRLFPQYLREAGYYCTNNSKTDYNLRWDEKTTWDESSGSAHWKHRRSADQPFFAVFNLTMTHESKVWPRGWKEVASVLSDAELHRPENMIVPPLYPDTLAVRQDLARLADLITVMDRRVGEILKELDEAGLSEDTIVIFWSDHGDGLPRAKRWTYDSGSRVPLIVRLPEKYESSSTLAAPGSTDDRLINLIDLGPTVLSLAGINVPDGLSGRPFLGVQQGPDRDSVYGARDRIDERFDLVRTVRSRGFRYCRNLMPWRPALQHITYGEQNATMQEMRKLLAEQKLAHESAQWFTSPRADEELYDLAADPWELTNLARDPKYSETLNELAAECDRWQLESRDAHLLPEILLDAAEKELGNRWQILHRPGGAERTQKLLAAAKLTARSIAAQTPVAMPILDVDPAVRWWQITACSKAPNVADFKELLLRETNSAEPAIRIAAAGGLARAGDLKSAAATLGALLGHENNFVRHAAILEIDEAGPEMTQLTQEQIRKIGDNDYCQRLAAHALDQIKGR
ncbi:MAG: sulfatase [Planctomycetaceae bacterium]|nr:sulfatase [Planctomycetaceae bacterium]